VTAGGADDERQVLHDLRILDLSRWVAGEFATRMLADFGADVVKIEKPGEGSLTRHRGPFPGDLHDPEVSALFLHLNTNKRSVVLDLTDPTDRDRLFSLVAGADALVESFRPGQLERLGLGPDVLLEVNPRLVITRISAFGQTGPYRDREATGLVLQAAGGPMSATGRAERAPLRKPGHLEQYTIGRTAAEATLAGLWSAGRTGRGSLIDVAGQEVLLTSADRRAAFLLTAAYSDVDAPRGVRSAHRGGATFTGPYRACDGFVMVYVTNAAFWNRFVRLVGADDDAFLAKYLDRTTLGDRRPEFDAYVSSWFAERPKMAIMEEAEAARIPLTAFLTVGEVRSHPHFRERGIFVEVRHPRAGTLEHVGAPWRMANGYRLRRPAPLLGEHTREILDHESSPKPGVRIQAGATHRTTQPLEGIRVVDLTVVWSGPGATALLGDLGAEVIRVEGNNRLSRQASAHTTSKSIAHMPYYASVYANRIPEPRPYDRSANFNWHARNKRAVCMNLETPEGRVAMRKLIAISDVFVENNSKGVLEKLGLHHEELLELNPRLVIVRMPPLGLSGPLSDYLGYGPNFNSLVGLAAMDGYEGEAADSGGDNYHMDEAAPAGVAFAVLAALWDREATGRGGLIEFAQAENVMQDIGEHFLDHQLNGREPAIMGNANSEVFQDVLPVAEPDRWIAVSVRSDDDWAALCHVLAADELVNLGASAELRAANRAQLVTGLAELSRRRGSDELVDALQAARVPSGEVMTERRLLADPHLAAREWFAERSHPAVGTYRYPGQPWRATGFDTVFGRPFPSFGEDNNYVYRELLGYDEPTYRSLVERGLVTDDQRA
jgi:crotonobetainyl-CoA:carnitine CoA-transferase CaiB-like acyl-CoA transferase